MGRTRVQYHHFWLLTRIVAHTGQYSGHTSSSVEVLMMNGLHVNKFLYYMSWEDSFSVNQITFECRSTEVWSVTVTLITCIYFSTANTSIHLKLPVVPRGRIEYSFSVNPFSKAWVLICLLNISLPKSEKHQTEKCVLFIMYVELHID